MTGHSYAEAIKRTPAGAVDDYYYFKLGRKIRSEAFHAYMKDLWTRFAGETDTVPSNVAIGLRWETEPSR